MPGDVRSIYSLLYLFDQSRYTYGSNGKAVIPDNFCDACTPNTRVVFMIR